MASEDLHQRAAITRLRAENQLLLRMMDSKTATKLSEYKERHYDIPVTDWPGFTLRVIGSEKPERPDRREEVSEDRLLTLLALRSDESATILTRHPWNVSQIERTGQEMDVGDVVQVDSKAAVLSRESSVPATTSPIIPKCEDDGTVNDIDIRGTQTVKPEPSSPVANTFELEALDNGSRKRPALEELKQTETRGRQPVCVRCWETGQFCNSSGQCEHCIEAGVNCVRILCKLGEQCKDVRCIRSHWGEFDERDPQFEVTKNGNLRWITLRWINSDNVDKNREGTGTQHDSAHQVSHAILQHDARPSGPSRRSQNDARPSGIHRANTYRPAYKRKDRGTRRK